MIRYVSEVSHLLALTKAFYMCSYRIGYSEIKSQNFFKKEVFEKIKNIYLKYNKDYGKKNG